MGLLDWFRRGRKKKVDDEKEALERTGKLRMRAQTEIEKGVEKEPKKRKKESD